MKKLQSGVVQVLGLLVVGALALGLVYLAQNLRNFSGNTNGNAQVLSEASVDFSVKNTTDIANQDGNNMTVGGDKAWIGNAQSTTQSYLGMRFTGGAIPAGAQIKSASVELTAVGSWIRVATKFSGDTSGQAGFSTSSLVSSRSVTSSSSNYSDDVKWEANAAYTYDVTDPVKELVGTKGATELTIIVKGAGSAFGRKDIYANPAAGKAPKLHITYVTSTGTTVPSATPTATPIKSATPIATNKPFDTSTPRATATPTPTPVPTSTPASTSSIYGAVSADLLGTCTAEVHDRYVVKGPDGVMYRTWHPQTVPVDANNPNGPKCTFAHEHGDNPATSNIFRGPVPFDYVPHLAGMDEPHSGFKCFVHNKGMTNEEGGTALHDSYYCFHMGTGGAARFGARFHSLDFHIVTAKGARMDIVGLADTGNVGTICDDPRQQRTVMGFGCKLDSNYEIWENRLNIVNKGNTVAQAITSTAVFDSITVMDPSDKTKLIYVWDPAAQANIFKFNNDRTGSRGCDREAYSGPVMWYNKSGVQTYYTDVYGNVVDGGPVKQTVSVSNTTDAGALTQFGGLIMAYKGGNDPQTQFKYRKSSCAPGLGLKN